MTKEGIFRTVPISIQLKEGNTVEEINSNVQLLKTGQFTDPRYGAFEIKKEHLENMILKFNEGVRGIELMIDYKHDSEAEAAGWIKSLDIIEAQLSEANEAEGIEAVNEHQLWAQVDWTPAGTKKLADREYAYLSADFDTNYKDNENPEIGHGYVLKGAALTNRPVIKRMDPAIQLSEGSSKTIMENEKMTTKKLSELEEENVEMSDKLKKVDAFLQDMGVGSVEDLMKMVSELRSSNEEMLGEKLLSEKKTSLDALLKEGKINAAQHEGALKLSEEEFKGFLAMAKVGETTVKLSETGTNETPSEEATDDGDVQDKVIELAETKMKENEGMSFSDATSLVLSENKELAAKYSDEV